MKYELRFNFNETEFIQGGAYFNLIVNETAIEKIEEIVIYKHPDIIGNGFDIDKPVVYELNAGSETSVWINASSAISQLVVSGSNLTSMGLPDNSIDFTSAASNVLTDWANAVLHIVTNTMQPRIYQVPNWYSRDIGAQPSRGQL